ncbi:hypothetical protein D1007_05125 [Hordeum vulgare]|nr:hypothetical protein D1007_05125 [Hordeum vulgare]
MEEKAVQNLVKRIGESIVWGPDQEMGDAEWVAQKQMLLPMISELTVIGEERRDDANEEEGHNGAGTVVCIYWNDVDLEEHTDLVIAPIADIKMAKLFGIPLDDRDKEKDDTSVPADDVDDADDNELINLYDKENPVIEVGKLWPNMDEFRMCFKTYAVNHEFEARTLWTDQKKFYARCQGYDGGANPCQWYISAIRQHDGSTIRCEPVFNAPEQCEPIFDAHEPILQTEPVLELVVQTELVLELVVQSELVMEFAVQSEIVAEVEEVHEVKHAEVQIDDAEGKNNPLHADRLAAPAPELPPPFSSPGSTTEFKPRPNPSREGYLTILAEFLRYNTLTEYLLQSAEEQNCSNQQQHNTATWISTRGASAARAHEQQQLVLQVQWKISKLISEK